MPISKVLFGFIGIVLTGIFIPTIFYGIEPKWLFVLNTIGFGYLFFLFKWQEMNFKYCNLYWSVYFFVYIYGNLMSLKVQFFFCFFMLCDLLV